MVKEYVVIKSKGKAVLIHEDGIPEEVKVNAPNVVEVEPKYANPERDSGINVGDVATPSTLKLLLKISPPFP